VKSTKSNQGFAWASSHARIKSSPLCLLHILRHRGARLRPWKRGRIGRAAGGGEQEGEAEVSYTRGEVSVEEDVGWLHLAMDNQMEGKTSQLTLPCRMELIEDNTLIIVTVSGIVNQHHPPHWRSAGRSSGAVEWEMSSREGVLPAGELQQATTMSNRWLRPSDRWAAQLRRGQGQSGRGTTQDFRRGRPRAGRIWGRCRRRGANPERNSVETRSKSSVTTSACLLSADHVHLLHCAPDHRWLTCRRRVAHLFLDLGGASLHARICRRKRRGVRMC
jgi:hypothetical protein